MRTPLLRAAVAGALLAGSFAALADSTPQTLPFSQNWTDTGLLTTTNVWTGVSGIEGYSGTDGTTTASPYPNSILVDPIGGDADTLNVGVNQANPNTNTNGGLAEFDITDDVVALQGSGTSDAPYLLINLNTTGFSNVVVTYNARDIDGSADSSTQPVFLQYRVCSGACSGNFTQVPGTNTAIADASEGPSLATKVTAVTGNLPSDADNKAHVQLRILTINAAGTDEWIGIDDISVTGSSGVTPFAIQPVAALVNGFDSLAATGTSSSMPNGFTFSETGGDTSYTADDGTASTGGVYSYGNGVNSERALGTLRDGSVAPIIGARLLNDTGREMKFLYVNFNGEQWRRDSAGTTADRLRFEYSSNATSLTDGAATWTALSSLDFLSKITTATTGALDGNDSANQTHVEGMVEGLAVANGSHLWIRWVDEDAAGNDDGLAIDDLQLGVPVVSIESADSLTEGNIAGCPVPNNLTFTVSRLNGVPSTGIPFIINTADVDASAGADYTAQTNVAQSVLFGGTISQVMIPILCDDTDEPNETFTVAITTAVDSGVFALDSADTATGTILDDDVAMGVPSITIGNASKLENQGGCPTNTLSFTVTSSQTAGVGGLNVTFNTVDGTATVADNDYNAVVGGTATILEGATTGTATVNLRCDTTIEPDQTFDVQLVDGAAYDLGSPQVGTGTIQNDDVLATISVAATMSVPEGNSGTPMASVQISTDVVPQAPATVDFETIDGTALQASDYTLTEGTASITCAPGPALPCGAVVNVPLLPDLTPESDKNFTVLISNPVGTNVQLGNTSATVTISNDDTSTEIAAIQGSGFASPLNGQIHTVNGAIVTGLIGNGFFMQDPSPDALFHTSDAMFVFTSTSPTAPPFSLALGDMVDVRGTLQESAVTVPANTPNYSNLTKFNATGLIVNKLSSGNALPDALMLDAARPSSDPTNPSCAAGTWTGADSVRTRNYECMESMLVATTTGMVNLNNQSFGSDPVAEMKITTRNQRAFREGGLGSTTLAAETVPTLVPPAPALPTTYVYDGNPEVFELDRDRFGLANDPIVPGSTFSATGVLAQEFGDYELFPHSLSVDSAAAALPTPVAEANDVQLTVASQNLHLLFDTVNDPWNNDDCSGTPDPDFCPSQSQYDAKVAVLSRQIREQLRSPMVIGAQEIEGQNALDGLVAKLNTDLAGAFTYTAHVGAIDDLDGGHQNVGFLIRDDVTVVSLTQQKTTETWTFNGTPQGEVMDRPPYLLRAQVNLAGGVLDFAVMVMHQRSLSGIDNLSTSVTASCSDMPCNVNAHRVRQKRLYQAALSAQAIQEFRLANPTTPLYVVGDMNAFRQSDGYADVVGILAGTADPALAEYNLDFFSLTGSGTNGNIVTPPMTLVSDLTPANEDYSFRFQDTPQQIDHALVNEAGLERLEDMQFSRGNVDQQYVHAIGSTDPLVTSDHDGFVLYISARMDNVFGDGFESD